MCCTHALNPPTQRAESRAGDLGNSQDRIQDVHVDTITVFVFHLA